MLGAFGEVQLISWSLPTHSQLANPEIVGTPFYMPPEQARGQRADCRSDVFGLGGILCHILTGKPPFNGEDVRDVLESAAAGDLTETFARLDSCGAASQVIELCKRCLSPTPAERPANGGEVAAAITAYRESGK